MDWSSMRLTNEEALARLEELRKEHGVATIDKLPYKVIYKVILNRFPSLWFCSPEEYHNTPTRRKTVQLGLEALRTGKELKACYYVDTHFDEETGEPYTNGLWLE